ncbi:unnamed protein product, partial [marine sediment metagenome]
GTIEQYHNAFSRIGTEFKIRNIESLGRESGELQNFYVAVDMIRHGLHGHVIYLTDDESAQAFALDWLKPVRIGCVWSSYDFILYLFVRYRSRISADEAKTAMRTVNANASSGSDADKWLRKLSDYENRLNIIDRLISNLY